MEIQDKGRPSLIKLSASKCLFGLMALAKSSPEEEVAALQILREIQSLPTLPSTELQCVIAMWLGNKLCQLGDRSCQAAPLASLLERFKIE